MQEVWAIRRPAEYENLEDAPELAPRRVGGGASALSVAAYFFCVALSRRLFSVEMKKYESQRGMRFDTSLIMLFDSEGPESLAGAQFWQIFMCFIDQIEGR